MHWSRAATPTRTSVAARCRATECAWDHVAGALVAREAGCTVTDVHGRPMDFGGGRRLAASEGVLCAAPGLHPALLAALVG